MVDPRKIENIGVSGFGEYGESHNVDAYAFLDGCMPHKYDAIITDPPYEIAIDNKKWDIDPLHIDWLAYQFHRVLKPGGNIFIFCSDLQFGRWHQELSRYFHKALKFAWVKTNTIGYRKGYFQSSFELAIHACDYGAYFDRSDYYKDSYVSAKTPRGEILKPDEDEDYPDPKKLHPTQKSYELIKTLVTALSKEDDLILDPFSGTGTLAEAAKKNGRKSHTVEFSFRHYLAGEGRLR